jgi:glycosyltransferase involved in cell wall biosynthesis
MVTSLPTAYPYRQDKVTVIGQGIDTELFAPDNTEPDNPPMILCVGRLSPVKDHPTLLKAAHLSRQNWGKRFQVVILGKPATPQDEVYVCALHAQVKELGLEGFVRFEPAIPMGNLPVWYRRCTVHVNLTPTGFGDKVAWEAMACGRPCIVANEGFRKTLGNYADLLFFRHGDPKNLSEKLLAVHELSTMQREQIGLYLRNRVFQMHSLEKLADRLVSLFESI